MPVPPDAVMVVVDPLQIANVPAVATIVGDAFTVNEPVPVPVQPAALIPVTVYMVVTVGLAVTGVPVDADRLVAGAQLYVAAPDAVMVELVPLHIAAGDGVTVSTGIGFTVTVTVAVVTHPGAVPVTVYVLVAVVVVVTVAPVVALILVLGAQV